LSGKTIISRAFLQNFASCYAKCLDDNFWFLLGSEISTMQYTLRLQSSSATHRFNSRFLG
jgi:chloramphenicol 3-O-phosphotransferase